MEELDKLNDAALDGTKFLEPFEDKTCTDFWFPDALLKPCLLFRKGKYFVVRIAYKSSVFSGYVITWCLICPVKGFLYEKAELQLVKTPQIFKDKLVYYSDKNKKFLYRFYGHNFIMPVHRKKIPTNVVTFSIEERLSDGYVVVKMRYEECKVDDAIFFVFENDVGFTSFLKMITKSKIVLVLDKVNVEFVGFYDEGISLDYQVERNCFSDSDERVSKLRYENYGVVRDFNYLVYTRYGRFDKFSFGGIRNPFCVYVFSDFNEKFCNFIKYAKKN